MNFSDILIDRRNRPRSGWRFAAFVVAFMVAVIALSAVVYPIASIFKERDDTRSQAISFVLGSLTLLLPAAGIGWLCGRLFEQLPYRALGAWFTGQWLVHFAAGCGIGAATLLVAVLVAVTGGGLWFSFNFQAGWPSIIETLFLSFLVFAVAAASEEVLFRGYPLQTFVRSGLGWLAVAVTAVLFGFAHANNRNVGWIALLNTTLAGIWFGAAYLKTRDLWFVWGLHLVWNWLQGSVFGVEVSGLTDITRFPILHETDSGPAWLTGGDYGIEGGIACTAALIMSAITIQFLLPIRATDEMLELTGPAPSEAGTPLQKPAH